MRTIFERETEIGKCDAATFAVHNNELHGTEPVQILAHTVTTLCGQMMKIEHRCYLRQGTEVPEQEWVKPEMMLEPAVGGEREMVKMSVREHEAFIERAKAQLPEEWLLAPEEISSTER